MISSQFPAVFSRHNRFRSVPLWLLCCLLFAVVTSASAANNNKSYLRLEQNKDSELNDYKITSIGALMFQEDAEAHLDLLHLESDTLGNSLALDFGGGYVLSGDISLFLGVGISLDYNFDTNDFNDKYYAEAGAVIDISRTISITARKQHFFHQPDDYEEVIMLGILFRH